MQVVFHLGAYSTDVDRLTGTLMQNPGVLERHGICIPPAALYRAPLREMQTALREDAPMEEMADSLIELCAGPAADTIERLILAQGNFLASPDRIITTHGLYPDAFDKASLLPGLFPEDEAEFHLALLNPALLLSTLVSRQSPRRSYDDILAGQPPETLRWGPVVSAVAEAAQGRPLIVWCNEDMPVLQPDLERSLAGLPAENDEPLKDDMSLLESLLPEEGLQEMQTLLADAGDRDARRAAAETLLEKYVPEENVETEMDLPGWTQDLLDEVEANYEEDIDLIARMPEVTFLSR